jgi:transposase
VVELIVELKAIDRKMNTLKKELTALVTARGSPLLQVNGIGPAGAARLLADVGNIHRFTDRDKFASWNGTAPLDASSGKERHRLSRAGNRRINRTPARHGDRATAQPQRRLYLLRQPQSRRDAPR